MPTSVDDITRAGVTGNDNPSGMDTGRGIAKANNFPIVEPRAVNAFGQAPYTPPSISTPPIDNIYDDLPPLMTPEMAERNSKQAVARMGEDVRRLVNSSYLDDYMAAQSTGMDEIMKHGPRKGVFNVTGDRYSLNDSHYRRFDGTWVPKYESYLPGVDNDDRLARQQSNWQKWGRGLTKFAAKSAMYGLGGIVDPFYGLYSAISKGRWDAVYNNDFTKWLDDMDKTLDYSLAHYYTKEERDMNVLQSMLTANFWSGDFLSGLAFTAGAMISSAAFAGAGLMNMGRGLARVGMRVGAGLGRLKGASSMTKGAFNAYLRGGARVGKALGDVGSYGTFMATSSVWEGSVESLSSMKEAEQNFRDSYREIYGKDPSYNEVMRFKATNMDASNAIFAANIGILSLSNMSVIGRFFNKSFGVDDFIKRNVFGVRATRGADGVIKGATQGAFQRRAANVYNIAKAPFMEGIFEEGLQGVASKAGEAYVDSRFNPYSINSNIGFMEAVKKGFKETYGTKEGWKEIGIGMLIGGGMSMVHGGNPFSENRRDVDALGKMVDAANKANGKLTDAAINAIRGSMMMNAQISALDQMDDTDRNGVTRDHRGRLVMDSNLGDAMFDRFRYDDELGLLDDSRENFHHIIDNIPDKDIMSNEGYSVEEARAARESIKAEYDRKFDNYKKASRFADNVTEGLANLQFNNMVAKMAYDGMDAKDELMFLARVIGDTFMDRAKVEKASDIYMRLNGKDATSLLDRRKVLVNDLAGLEDDIVRLQNKVTTADTAKSVADELNKKRQELVDRQNELNDIDYRLSSLANSNVDFGSLVGIREGERSREITPADIAEAESTVRQLEYIVGRSEYAGKDAAARLFSLYRENLVNYKRLDDGLKRMMDPRFISAQERGFTAMLQRLFQKTYDEDDARYDFMNTDNPDAKGLYANDLAIDKAVADGKIDEAEGYMFKTYNHMIARAVRNVAGEREFTDPVDDATRDRVLGISDEDFDAYAGDPAIAGIRDKLFDGVRLSENEKAIYERFKDQFDALLNRVSRFSPLARLNRAKEVVDRYGDLATDDPVKRARAVIDNTIRMSRHMSTSLEEDANSLWSFITEYMRLSRESRRRPLTVYEADTLNTYARYIQNFDSRIDLLPYVDQMIDFSGLDEDSLPVMGMYIDMESLDNEAFPNVDENENSSPDAAQNPVILMGKIDKFGSSEYCTVSGMRIDRFVDTFTMEDSDGVRKTILPVPGSDSVRYVATRKEVSRGGELVADWVFKPESPVDGVHGFTLSERADHFRWHVKRAYANELEAVSDLVFEGLTTLSNSKWVVLRKRGADGTTKLYETSNEYGSGDRAEAIDQDALSSLKKNDKLILEVEMDDEFNERLYTRYKGSLDVDPSGKEADDAREALRRNLVIKVRKADGNHELVSVVKGLDRSSHNDIVAIRDKALELYLNEREGKDGPVNKVIRLPMEAVVRQDLPGRANYQVREVEGGYQVYFRPVAREEMSNIVDVGYVVGDKLELVKKTRARKHPFATAVDNVDYKVPVVVIKARNGNNYVYPVRLADSKRLDIDTTGLEDMASGNISEGSVEAAINAYNDMVRASGLDPRSYAVPLGSSLQTLQGMAGKFKERLGKGIFSIDDWIGSGRSVEDIVLNDVLINVDARDAFVGPKIRMRLAVEDNAGEGTRDVEAPTVDPSVDPSDSGIANEGNTSAGTSQVNEDC